jgi:RIO-like serine/threonine protein kinase
VQFREEPIGFALAFALRFSSCEAEVLIAAHKEDRFVFLKEHRVGKDHRTSFKSIVEGQQTLQKPQKGALVSMWQ